MKQKKASQESPEKILKRTSASFDSEYRPAVFDDFGYGLTWYRRGSVNAEVSASAVYPEGSLAQQASRFQDAVLRNEAYLPNKRDTKGKRATDKKIKSQPKRIRQ